eukprot:CAMPEP_0194529458 /NCGR_PEP_ID=MMETSP0253-20130528/66152_1 /TAXON_ID=2966 /ORGANISM="Noctiluca scintillans" /LENGTH=606 /DNA_ID=CAMNT_0039374601 /DNA_START=1 /DNA_END=1821 /DNA_ORIENTATION=+
MVRVFMFVSFVIRCSCGSKLSDALDASTNSLVDLVDQIRAKSERDASEFTAFESHAHQSLSEGKKKMSDISNSMALVQSEIQQLQGLAQSSEQSAGPADMLRLQNEKSEIESIRNAESEQFLSVKDELQIAMAQLKQAYDTLDRGSYGGLFLQKSRWGQNRRVEDDVMVGIHQGLRMIGVLTGKQQTFVDVGQHVESDATMRLLQSSIEVALLTAEDKLQEVEAENKRSLDFYEKVHRKYETQLTSLRKSAMTKQTEAEQLTGSRARLDSDMQTYISLLSAVRLKYEEMSHELVSRRTSFHSQLSYRSKELRACQEALALLGTSGLMEIKEKHAAVSMPQTQDFFKSLFQDVSRFSPNIALQLLSLSSQDEVSDPFAKARSLTMNMISRLEKEGDLELMHHKLCEESEWTTEFVPTAQMLEIAIRDENNRVRTLRREFSTAKMQADRHIQSGLHDVMDHTDAERLLDHIVSLLTEYHMGDSVKSGAANQDEFTRTMHLLQIAKSEVRRQIETTEKEEAAVEEVLNLSRDEMQRELARSTDVLKQERDLLHQMESEYVCQNKVTGGGNRQPCSWEANIKTRTAVRAAEIQALQGALAEVNVMIQRPV